MDEEQEGGSLRSGDGLGAVWQKKEEDTFFDALPEYDIDLDKEPEDRWEQVTLDYLDQFHALQEYSHACAVVDFGGETIGPILLNTCSRGLSLSSAMNAMMTSEMKRELQGIARHTEAIGLGFKDLLILNAGYDLLARCTSIVTEGPDGTPIHVRNMDWDLDQLRGMTINCNFKKGGKTIYKATMHAGLTGVFTGMRLRSEENPDEGYSLSLNYRKTGSPLSLGYNLFQLFGGGWGIGYFIRQALETKATFKEAVDFLSRGSLMAPCYILAAGINRGEGCLITRDRKSEVNRLELSDNEPFILVTNIDHWVDTVDPDWAEEDPLLLNSIERRVVATARMKELHNALKEKKETMKDFVEQCFHHVLESSPVCNFETLYSAVMAPSSSFYAIRLFPEQPAKN